MLKASPALFLLASPLMATGGTMPDVPEPTIYLMFGAGLTAIMLIQNRFSKKQ